MTPAADGTSTLSGFFTSQDTEAPVFVVLSFEGPDAYAQAGGLGTRVSGLTRAIAEAGFETHLFFVGAPDLPPNEVLADGKLHLHRWCQWISRHHLGGVYDGEEAKVADWTTSLAPWLEEQFLPPLMQAKRTVVVMAEEWQTAESVLRLDEGVRRHHWKRRVRILWNANNTYGFDRVAWDRLQKVATLTTVSRFMKHEMWKWGVDARVIPNGIPESWSAPADRRSLGQLRRVLQGRLGLTKVARWDPDKRWLMAVDATADLKRRGLRPILLAKGGVEAHGQEVLERARMRDLRIGYTQTIDETEQSLCQAVASGVAANVDALVFRGGLAQRQLRVLYRAVDAVLANSGVEPFGLVGLEAMASGGVVFVGATGEDYLTTGHDGVSLQTNHASEIVGHLVALRNHPENAKQMRRAARSSAARYAWPQVLRRNIVPMLQELRVPVVIEREISGGSRPLENGGPNSKILGAVAGALVHRNENTFPKCLPSHPEK